MEGLRGKRERKREGDSGVTRICCEEGQNWRLCYGALTADFRAGYSSCLMTNIL